ncbi:trans-homoaconitate synthase [Halococcus morrhuae DSM 1307]|uniref:Trans-homoaconitate synthase n=2 Tax=Halococcus morrhuae TaxID=2250 RepID=M0MQ89_HALMO|nr:trans-homoaconitate synthase [Halococcus morrhuae]EMA46630.1 trans-homoaconitate synthase [Halococcus morrhuae DSM 1307]
MQLTDVTIRESAQMPGRSYTAEQRIQAGEAIDSLGVDRLQPGFPAAGEIEREVVRELSSRADAETVAIARALEQDVEAAVAANADVVEVFAPISELHLKHDLGKSRDEVLEMMDDALRVGRKEGITVQLMILDGFRTENEHLLQVFERFDDLRMIGLADTVGRRSPTSVRSTLEQLSSHVDIGRVGVHFHNDLGVGSANVLTAYECGVSNADLSIAALGERVGNPALEEIVAIGDLEYDDSFGVDPQRLIPVADEVIDALGEEISARKPILGREATTHEAGLHTAAMLDEPSAFEPFDPSRFGGERTLIFGEGTGRGGARKILESVGIKPNKNTIDDFLKRLSEQGPMDREDAQQLAEDKAF